MYNQLPMFQHQGASAYKKDLNNTYLLSNYLNNPEKKLNCVHVAGTNGKGSTSHMLSSIFQEAGYKVGLYTSPHLKDYRERIKINGEKISKKFVLDFINSNKTFFEANDLSFFEMTVGLAFDYFAKEKVEICIVEVGMGGRLDATNIINPMISIITNIGLDHTQFLGNTLEAIAYEKAGIIKPNTPVVIGEYTTETKLVFLTKAKENNSEIYFASELISKNYPSDLIGDYQIHNKKTVAQSINIINALGKFNISDNHIENGLLNVTKNTGLNGRWQQLGNSPKIICDTAHNKNGLETVINQINKENFETLHIVLGVVNDKDLEEILPLFPKKAIYYFCKPNIPRGLDPIKLQEKAALYNLKGLVYNSVSESYQSAIEKASMSDFIFIGGSTFVVAEIL